MSREDWLRERRKGIGSSDSPAIHGASKYMTALELYEDKISDVIDDSKTNWAMERGNELEPIARKMFSARLGLDNGGDDDFAPTNIISAELPFMRASMDGLSRCKRYGLEIKYQGKKEHEATGNESLSIKERIREMYWIQCQHQIFVGSLEYVYFVSYNPDADVKMYVVIVEPDKEFLSLHIKKCTDFWLCVENKTPPEPSPKDFVSIKGHRALESAWIEIKNQIDFLEQQKEEIEEKIKALATHPRSRIGLVGIREESRKGSIKYADIPAIKSMSPIELDGYRSKPVTFKKIYLIKEGKEDL